MDAKSLDELPNRVAEGTLSEADALNSIAETIYRFPVRFGLAAYDEDFQSEIIVLFLQKGAHLFKRFNSSHGLFHSFLYSFIQGLVLTEKRNKIKNLIEQNTVTEFMYEDDFEKPDKNLFAAEKTVHYAPTTHNTHIWKTLSKRCTRKEDVSTAKTALILALKSSYYIPLDAIDEVSAHCRLQSAELQRLIANLNSLLYTRIRRRNMIIKRRDNAYYFHRKYLLQMKYCNKETTDMEQLSKRYTRQTENWKNKNSDLQERRYRVCPTNKMIARLLGICERQVSYYITRAQKMVNGKCDKDDSA
ncbi:MAG: hypothetical protein IJR50_08660 [Treponema sp.]|nr:hypothetical protein [Treponema sp.]